VHLGHIPWALTKRRRRRRQNFKKFLQLVHHKNSTLKPKHIIVQGNLLKISSNKFAGIILLGKLVAKTWRK
jgi:hypothetical protein